ncbi:MAG: aryl-sulfate sulfotransferase [Myxococcota bacterium]
MRPALLLVLAACTQTPSGEGKDTDTSPTGGDDTGTSGPTDPSTAALDVTARIADKVQTVVIVSWRTETETRGRVEFGASTDYGLVSNTTAAGTEHEVMLLGMNADTEVHFRVVTDGALGEQATGDHTITTGSLPTGVPPLIATGDPVTQWNYQVIPMQGGSYAVTIVDNAGHVVWYYMPEAEGNLMKAVLSHDRTAVVLGHAGSQDALEEGEIVWIGLDGELLREEPFPYFDHDLTELPDGTIAAIVVESREREDGGQQQADQIVELAPDGTLTQIWSAWDTLDPDDYGLTEPNWTHSNAIEYLPDEDAYYLSMKSPGTIARIERSTGEIDWMLNGKMNQFTFPDDVEMVQMQHQFEVLDGRRMLIFDNGLQDRAYSRVQELQLDEVNMTVEELWTYVRDPSVYVFAKGDVARFADGTTQVVWSSSGEIQLVDADGELIWQANAELGQAITFTQPFDDFYVRE